MFHDPVSSLDCVCGTENFHGLATFRAEHHAIPAPWCDGVLLPPPQLPDAGPESPTHPRAVPRDLTPLHLLLAVPGR